MKSKPGSPLPPEASRREVRMIMRHEFVQFFELFTNTPVNARYYSNEDFVHALASALLEVGMKKELGAAYLQMLIGDLQIKLNERIKE